MFKKLLYIFISAIVIIVVLYYTASLGFKPFLLKQLSQALKRRVEAKSVSLSFPLNLQFKNLRIFNKGEKDMLLTAEGLDIGVNPFSLFSQRLLLNHIVLISPNLKIEKNTEGILNIEDLLNPEVVPVPGPKKKKAAVLLRAEIKKGEIELQDKTVSPLPFTAKIAALNLKVAKVYFPPASAKSNFSLSFNLVNLAGQIRGSARAQGWINIIKKDMLADLEIKNIDIAYFKPYYKSGFSTIENGLLNFASSPDSKNNNLTAPCRLEISNLSFAAGSEASSELLGVSVADLVDYLKDSRGKISMGFTLRGKMDKPQELISQTSNVVIKATLQKLVNSQLQRLLEFGEKTSEGVGTTTGKTKEKLEDIRKVLEGIFKSE